MEQVTQDSKDVHFDASAGRAADVRDALDELANVYDALAEIRSQIDRKGGIDRAEVLELVLDAFHSVAQARDIIRGAME